MKMATGEQTARRVAFMRVVRRAREFVKASTEEMQELKGSISLDIPVEFMNLHDAVNELDTLLASAPPPKTNKNPVRRCREV